MAIRHLFMRLTPRLDRRVLVAAAIVGAIAAAGSFIRWGAPPASLQLVALAQDGAFGDSVGVPTDWVDTETVTPDAVVRVPLLLAVRNAGTAPARPGRIELSLPVPYRLVPSGREELDPEIEPGSPLLRYTIRPLFGPIEPQRLPELLPGYDTLWLEVVVPSYYCVMVGDSVPDFVPAPPPAVESMSALRIFYSIDGGDLRRRQTGVLTVTMDPALLHKEMPPSPPSFPMEVGPEARPDLGPLRYVGSRNSLCGDPGAPIELRSQVWEAIGGARVITLDYGDRTRKHLYDLTGDGVVDRESWDPAGDGSFAATRRARFAIPEFVLPVTRVTRYDMDRFHALSPDSLARLDPFRRAMAGPGQVPTAADTRFDAPPRPAPPVPSRPAPAAPGVPAATPVPAHEPAPVAPEPDARPELPAPRPPRGQPLGRPLPPDSAAHPARP